MAVSLDLERALSRTSKSWRGEDNALSRSFSSGVENDEEALKWAALEKLPTYDRLRKSVLSEVAATGSFKYQNVDVTTLSTETRRKFIHRVLQVAEVDNEQFLSKLRERIERVGIQLPTIEVRFDHLTVDADVHVGSRALPTLINFTSNLFEGFLNYLHILRSKRTTLTILHDVSGIIKPSRMTLLLGPPGAGKTTLLTALAGKHDRNLRITGDVTYNGHSLIEFVPQRTCSYISQHDLHFAEMTVRETLDFSGQCQGVGSRYDLLKEISRREKQAGIKPDPDVDVFMKETAIEGQRTNLFTDYVLKLLGLDICADTLIGDQMLRGVSGGQKKRVTTGEMLVARPKALFMDEISTGLDSATTFNIVKCLRQIVHVLDGTMLIALLQPAPETFELFDDIILLSEGEIVYQGPREYVLEYFESMGFKCPDRKGVADFLQEVSSRKDQEQYWVDRSQPYHYIPVKEFAEAFKSFHVGKRLTEELSHPFDRTMNHPASLTYTNYGVSRMNMFKACFSREVLLMKRHSFVYVFKSVQIAVVGVITMTLFLRTEMHQRNISDGNLYMGAMFFGLVNMMFDGFPEMSMTVARLPVFYKQRDDLFYPAWAYALPTWIVKIPISFLEAFILVSVTYYVIGFAPEAERFFRQIFLLSVLHEMALGLFRFTASLGRNMVISQTLGVSALLTVFVLGGFVISRENVPSWWIWAYWCSPLSYGQNALAVNEFLAPRWNKPSGTTLNETLGHAIIEARGLFAEAKFYWISIGALVGFCLIYNILFTLALAYLNPFGKSQGVLSEDVIEEKHVNRTGESSHGGELSSVDASGKHSRGHTYSLERKESSNSEFNSTHDGELSDLKASVPQKNRMVLPFQPLSIAFENVNYYVDMPQELKNEGMDQNRLQLLYNISGSFKPGVLTALMGVSGAGKTTLMDVLAGRKTGGYIEGSISISGYPKNQETFARISGYCEQNDIHSPNVTVYESLVYSAWLRLPRDFDERTRTMFVQEVMELVELTPLRDALVGLPGVTGLSTEQRKRLTIAVELVANPSIIFMDEPTSGLDARSAAVVMRTVRNTVDTGRTVVCTIHQPSIDIFESFDELLLMKRGGQVIYAGPLGQHSHKLVEYFESVEGVPPITEGYNPATWVLEVSSISIEQSLGIDFADIYSKSSLYEWNQQFIKELSTPAPGSEKLNFPSQYAQSLPVQCMACLWKQYWSYWRNPHYVVVRFCFSAMVALLFGSIFWDLGTKRGNQQDIFNILGAMYCSVLFLGVSNASTVQPVVDVERSVFYRERAAGMYSAFSYAFGQVAIEVPYVLVQSVVYTLLVYTMIGFQWTAVKFFWFLFFMYFTLLYFTFFGMVTVAMTPNFHVAAIISSAFYSTWNLFCGFMIPRPKMPVWWRWYNWASPVSWTFYGLVASQLADVDTEMVTADGKVMVSEFIRNYLGMRHDFLGIVALVIVCIPIGFALLFGLAIKNLNFQRR
ncbi:ABC transporter G family member 39 [Cryptomeria japonica]|uniref:ABC transporter G family member 39 n=1 Tax=Cryptomeria japonica TaxID=3369 RepID=UPI0027DA1C53|nr:ABC transporter G family member 39 [Cryptomeria japonica]